eukprot:gnl/MRDRNA2_/MRDRNA2_28641_c0_seq2.p1 gnl/MRDRNA2_/MRDRNA2_28641_c0~~gnl/MRDRNA2_/MRDRNA2_28641_c0_seq2.p1  ORF type:complete len:112 (+),score=22.99 gnl/MRDRNA2_/MRDRNA2_28641_c0_seq2:134-469(+)
MAALTWLKDAVKRFARAHRCKHSVAQVVPPDCTIPTQVLICPEILNRSQKQKGDISPKGPKPNSCPGKLEKAPRFVLNQRFVQIWRWPQPPGWLQLSLSRIWKGLEQVETK